MYYMSFCDKYVNESLKQETLKIIINSFTNYNETSKNVKINLYCEN